MQNEETRTGGQACRFSAFRVPRSAFANRSVNPVQHILIGLVRVYRWTLSPAIPFLFGGAGRCRFSPSCSEYALDAVKIHGALAGSWLAAKRICRCHPWGGCGDDPVPPKKSQIPNLKFQIHGRRCC